ncbi:MAG TPA: creatininase family protein, partial [Thermoplasmata archaeon]|nr:creatininase family protein [Thermoplasmata archaeon]
MKWYEMTTEEFGRLVDEKTLVVVPFGILEEHGPHLPLGTDTIQVLHLVDMVEEELEKKGIKTVVAPPVHYG